MLKQATVEDIANSRITKRHGRIVVTTRYYPRFLKRKLVDDYFGSLAPTKELLSEFKVREDELNDHDLAFEDMNYQDKFTLDESGVSVLRDLSELARSQDVYLVCHCTLGQRCHREILLLMARDLFEAPIGRVYLAYPTIEKRLSPGTKLPSLIR